MTGAQWSPDGTQLVLGRLNHGTTQPPLGQAFFVVGASGGELRQLTPWEANAGGHMDWSSTSNLIAFRAVASEEAGIGNFFTIKPDGSGLTQVTHFDGTVISKKVSFSPDGQTLVFAKHEPGADGLFTVGVDGKHLRQLEGTPVAASAPDWTAT